MVRDKLFALINKLPYVRGLVNRLEEYKRNLFTPPGHYYSPIVSVSEISRYKDQIFAPSRELPGINLNDEKQYQWLLEYCHYYQELPFPDFPGNTYRYYYENDFFGYADGIFLFCIIRQFAPKSIIEVGSGFSSALMVDTNRLFYDNRIELTCIEPFPDRLESLLEKEDIYKLVTKPVQEVPVSFFEELEANDVLFIDSSHIVKTNSDVHYIIFEILPRLKKGVLIHFHDIFYPFEYPEEWVLKDNRSWNECYFLRAFLQYNTEFEIIAFNSFLMSRYRELLTLRMPAVLKSRGQSIWLKKR